MLKSHNNLSKAGSFISSKREYSQIKALLLCLFITIINVGCSSKAVQEKQYQACSQEWFQKVEKKILTEDEQGHGPDLGTLEWRSVIEFKLAISNDPNVPALESNQWCDYINEHYISVR